MVLFRLWLVCRRIEGSLLGIRKVGFMLLVISCGSYFFPINGTSSNQMAMDCTFSRPGLKIQAVLSISHLRSYFSWSPDSCEGCFSIQASGRQLRIGGH